MSDFYIDINTSSLEGQLNVVEEGISPLLEKEYEEGRASMTSAWQLASPVYQGTYKNPPFTGGSLRDSVGQFTSMEKIGNYAVTSHFVFTGEVNKLNWWREDYDYAWNWQSNIVETASGVVAYDIIPSFESSFRDFIAKVFSGGE